jgi:hypothetical protein
VCGTRIIIITSLGDKQKESKRKEGRKKKKKKKKKKAPVTSNGMNISPMLIVP